jgi:beta-xylosidase
MHWEDDWPVIGTDGKVPMTLDIPAGEQGASGAMGIVESDEFDRQAGDSSLPLAWQWNHNPVADGWSLTDRPGWLRLTTGRVDGEVIQARNTLTQRTFGPECSATTAIDASHMQDGDRAGLVALQKKYGWVGVRQRDDNRKIVMVSTESDSPVELATVPLEQDTVYLKIACDFKDRADKAYFYYSLDGDDWTAIGEPLQMAYTLPHFMGYRFGLFNYATKSPDGYVDFDFYRIENSMGE